MKSVPSKINTVQHVDDHNLLGVPQAQKGFQPKKTWTTEMIEYGNGPNVKTRLFDRVIASGNTLEKRNQDREKKLKEFFAQPQRGSTIPKMQDPNTEVLAANTKGQSAAVNTSQAKHGLPAEGSVSNPSKSEVSVTANFSN